MPTIDPRWEYANLVLPIDGESVKVTASRTDQRDTYIHISMQGLFSMRIRPAAAAILCKALHEAIGTDHAAA